MEENKAWSGSSLNARNVFGDNYVTKIFDLINTIFNTIDTIDNETERKHDKSGKYRHMWT